jgi:hypothetical protein
MESNTNQLLSKQLNDIISLLNYNSQLVETKLANLADDIVSPRNIRVVWGQRSIKGLCDALTEHANRLHRAVAEIRTIEKKIITP